MTNTWFRLYAEFATDPKVQMLSEADQRRYIMLLCLRCSNGDVTLQDAEVAFQLRISNEEWSITKASLMDKGLINEVSQPTAWDRRQFVSDSSAARVARHRERKRQDCNVTVTPPDTDTDTDTEKEKSKKKKLQAEGFEVFWVAYPRKVGKADALKAWQALGPDAALLAVILAGLERYVKSKPEWQEWKHAGPWLRQRRWEDEPDTAPAVKPLARASPHLTSVDLDPNALRSELLVAKTRRA